MKKTKTPVTELKQKTSFVSFLSSVLIMLILINAISFYFIVKELKQLTKDIIVLQMKLKSYQNDLDVIEHKLNHLEYPKITNKKAK